MCTFLSEESAQSISDRVHAAAQRLAPTIKRRFRRKLGPIRHIFDVHDLVSETNLRLQVAIHKGAITFRTDEELEHFILNNARCAANDAVRSEVWRQRRERRAADRMPIVTCAGIDEEPREQVQAVLAQVDETDRQLLVQCASGESHLTIAASLGLTVATYRSRWRRLRARLRTMCDVPGVPQVTAGGGVVAELLTSVRCAH